jgi:pimeloyl-ACP methyl ester carboxylesterase
MSTFVLVHGAWQSTGTWDLLAPLLEKHGHRVITPVLSGLGADQNRLSPDIALQQHVEDVSLELSRFPDQVILVGHSYAGMIISGVAERNPTQIQRLVFLDGFVPENGQSVLDLLPLEIGAHFREVAREHGDGWRLPAGEAQLDLWGLKPGAAFQPRSLLALRQDIRRGRSSSRLPEKPVLPAGRSPNWRLATTAMSNVLKTLRTSCSRPRCRNEVQPSASA